MGIYGCLRKETVLLTLSFFLLGIILACGGGGGGDDTVIPSAVTTVTGISSPQGDAVISSLRSAAAQEDYTAMEALFSADAWSSSYQSQLTSTNTDLQKLESDLANAELIRVETDFLLYKVETVENGKTYSYYIQMVKESDGSWKIVSM